MTEQGLSVRAAKESDVPILADILNAIILAGHTTALEKTLNHSEFAERFILGPSVLCCHVAIEVETSQPVGFQMLERDDDNSGERIDIATYARPEPKIAGVGTSLFAATIERAKVLGLTRIVAEIRADNRGGLAYYSKMGFRTFSTLRGVPLQDGSPVDRVLKNFDLA